MRKGTLIFGGLGLAAFATVPNAATITVNHADLCCGSVTADQPGTGRTQGAACDLGALEADYLLVDGLGG